MTFEEIAKKYFQTIWQASDKNEAVRAVQRKIDNLVYSESREAISHEHKLKIWQLIKKELEAQRRLVLENRNFSQMQKIAAASNDEAITTISTIIKSLGGLE